MRTAGESRPRRARWRPGHTAETREGEAGPDPREQNTLAQGESHMPNVEGESYLQIILDYFII